VENFSECGPPLLFLQKPLSPAVMTFSAAEGEVGVGCFLLRHLDLREPSLTQFTEDRERENEGGVDEKKNVMRDTGKKKRKRRLRQNSCDNFT